MGNKLHFVKVLPRSHFLKNQVTFFSLIKNPKTNTIVFYHHGKPRKEVDWKLKTWKYFCHMNTNV